MTNNYTQTGPYKLRMRTQYNIQMTMNGLALNEPHALLCLHAHLLPAIDTNRGRQFVFP